jgi:hypothetical protein
MAIMISKYYGVPSTMERALEQFEELKIKEDIPFNRGSFLVLMKQPSGLYKNLPVIWLYLEKPKKSSRNIIKIYQIPKGD